jgi:hypothetical protein
MAENARGVPSIVIDQFRDFVINHLNEIAQAAEHEFHTSQWYNLFQPILYSLERIAEVCGPCVLLERILDKQFNAALGLKAQVLTHGNASDPRFKAAMAWLQGKAVMAILDSNHQRLSYGMYQHLEDSAFANCTREMTADCKKVAKAAARNNSKFLIAKMREVWARVLGMLSRSWTKEIRNRIMLELGKKAKCCCKIRVVEALEFLELKPECTSNRSPRPEANQTLLMCEYFSTLLHDRRQLPSKARQALMKILTILMTQVQNVHNMRPCQTGASVQEGVVHCHWHEVVQQMYVLVAKLVKSCPVDGWPCLTAILCASHGSFCIRSAPKHIASLLDVSEKRETELVGLGCINTFLGVFLARQQEYQLVDEAALLYQLQMLVSRLLTPVRSKVPLTQQNMSLLVNMMGVISRHKVDFIMQNAVLELLQFEKNAFSQRNLLGIKALFEIMQNSRDAERKLAAENAELAGTVPMNGLLAKAISPYQAHLSEILSHILVTCDTVSGVSFASDSSSMAAASGLNTATSIDAQNEMVVEDHSFAGAFACLSHLAPTCLTSMQVLDMLCRNALHIKIHIRRAARAAIRELVLSEAEPIADLASFLRAFSMLIIDIPENFSAVQESSSVTPANTRGCNGAQNLIVDALSLLLDLLSEIHTRITNAPPQASNQPGSSRGLAGRVSATDCLTALAEVEGSILLTLCSASGLVRVMAIKVFQESQRLIVALQSAAGPTKFFNGKNTQIVHLLKEAEQELLSEYSREPDFIATAACTRSSDADGSTVPLPMLEWMATCRLGEQPAVWSKFLRRLVSRACELHPSIMSMFWSKACTRTYEAEPLIPVSSGQYKAVLQQAPPALWCHRATFACASTMLPVGTTASNRTEKQRKQFVETRDLLQKIVRFVNSPALDQRTVAVLAAGSAHPSTHSLLLEVLLPYELSAFNTSGVLGPTTQSRNGRLQAGQLETCCAVGSLYRNIVGRMQPDAWMDGFVRNRVLEYSQRAWSYLSELPTFSSKQQAAGAKMMFQIQLDFCVLARCIAEQCSSALSSSTAASALPPAVRQPWLQTLLSWCGDVVQKTRQGTHCATQEYESTERVVLPSDPQDRLPYEACTAMSALLSGPVSRNEEEARSLVVTVFKWVDKLLGADARWAPSVARTALIAFITVNPIALDCCVERCYVVCRGSTKVGQDGGRDHCASEKYFDVLVSFGSILQEQMCSPILLPKVMQLVLRMIAYPVTSVRRGASTLLTMIIGASAVQELSPVLANTNPVPHYSLGGGSTKLLLASCNEAQGIVSKQFSICYPELSVSFISELLIRLPQVNATAQQQMLAYVVPWLEHSEFCMQFQAGTKNARDMLRLLLDVTVEYAGVHDDAIGELWAKLALQEFQIEIVFAFLFSEEHKNKMVKLDSAFVQACKRIAWSMGTAAMKPTVKALVSQIQDEQQRRKMKDTALSKVLEGSWGVRDDKKDAENGKGGLVHAEKVHSSSGEDIARHFFITRAGLAVTILAELSHVCPSHRQAFSPKIAEMLHAAIMLWSFEIEAGRGDSILFKHCRLLLANLIRSFEQCSGDVEDKAVLEMRVLLDIKQAPVQHEWTWRMVMDKFVPALLQLLRSKFLTAPYVSFDTHCSVSCQGESHLQQCWVAEAVSWSSVLICSRDASARLLARHCLAVQQVLKSSFDGPQCLQLMDSVQKCYGISAADGKMEAKFLLCPSLTASLFFSNRARCIDSALITGCSGSDAFRKASLVSAGMYQQWFPHTKHLLITNALRSSFCGCVSRCYTLKNCRFTLQQWRYDICNLLGCDRDTFPQLLHSIFSKACTEEEIVVDVLLASKPTSWKAGFVDLQSLAFRGLLAPCEATRLSARRMLSKFTLYPYGELVTGKMHAEETTKTINPRLLVNMLGLMPWFFSTKPETAEEVLTAPTCLAPIFTRCLTAGAAGCKMLVGSLHARQLQRACQRVLRVRIWKSRPGTHTMWQSSLAPFFVM